MPDTTLPLTTAESPESSASTPASRGDGQGKDLLNRMTESAHGAVDRIAGKAGPAVQKLESGVTHANEALHEGAHRVREMGDQWTDSMRHTVREHPLTSVLLALAAGALIARIAR